MPADIRTSKDITHVWDGYSWQELVADTGDGWLTLRAATGETYRTPKTAVIPIGAAGFPVQWSQVKS